jgi:hypothetical protein
MQIFFNQSILRVHFYQEPNMECLLYTKSGSIYKIPAWLKTVDQELDFTPNFVPNPI